MTSILRHEVVIGKNSIKVTFGGGQGGLALRSVLSKNMDMSLHYSINTCTSNIACHSNILPGNITTKLNNIHTG